MFLYVAGSKCGLQASPCASKTKCRLYTFSRPYHAAIVSLYAQLAAVLPHNTCVLPPVHRCVSSVVVLAAAWPVLPRMLPATAG